MCSPPLQVKELEVAAARAAHDGTLQIEAALAEAASRTLTVAEVAELRGRLLEEQTAAADAISARRATAAPNAARPHARTPAEVCRWPAFSTPFVRSQTC